MTHLEAAACYAVLVLVTVAAIACWVRVLLDHRREPPDYLSGGRKR